MNDWPAQEANTALPAAQLLAAADGSKPDFCLHISAEFQLMLVTFNPGLGQENAAAAGGVGENFPALVRRREQLLYQDLAQQRIIQVNRYRYNLDLRVH